MPAEGEQSALAPIKRRSDRPGQNHKQNRDPREADREREDREEQLILMGMHELLLFTVGRRLGAMRESRIGGQTGPPRVRNALARSDVFTAAVAPHDSPAVGTCSERCCLRAA
jgi:hypothetical protein